MGAATRGTAGRWLTALAALAAVVVAPLATGRLPAPETELEPRDLLARVRGSGPVAYQGLAESTGNLGLPDLPRLGDVAALLGSTTRTRVWWHSPSAWRVDRLTSTGESGTYAVPGGVQTWDFESGSVRRVVGASPVRLPRVDDVVPPLAARRALSAVTRRDTVTALPARRVAGRDADGFRVVPADRTSTVGHLDVFADTETGLPLSLVVVPRGTDVAAMRAAFVQVSFGAPDRDALRPRIPPFGRVRTTETPDLAATVDRYAPFTLPTSLAGLRRSPSLLGSRGGTATYGDGLTRLVVLPLWQQLSRSAMEAATEGGGTPLDVGPGGQAVLVTTPLLNAVVARAGPGDRASRAYLVAGTVASEVLQSAVRELLDDPPPFE